LKNVRPTAYRWLLLTHGLPGALLAAVVSGQGGMERRDRASPRLSVIALSLAWTTGVWDSAIVEQRKGSGWFHCEMPLASLFG